MSDWPIGESFKFGEPDPEILVALLNESNTHDVREIGNGVYNHTFTPATKTFIPELWSDALQTTILNDLYASQSSQSFREYFKRFRTVKACERRKKKIERRQKRAAFRRRKRGLA